MKVLVFGEAELLLARGESSCQSCCESLLEVNFFLDFPPVLWVTVFTCRCCCIMREKTGGWLEG